MDLPQLKPYAPVISQIHASGHQVQIRVADQLNSKDLQRYVQKQQQEANERLLKAVTEQKHLEVKEIMQRFQIDINIVDKDGNNLVMIATMQRDLEMLKMLIVKHFNIDHQNNEGNTALHVACSGGQKVFVDLLLQYDAKEDLPNKDGLTCWEMYPS